jgi:DNA polymerase III subunit gamma/tau
VLQISSDERARVTRVAERFSEEDLSRFMQIMLRTYSELGYKQEQRFHLELGLLKLVHAQRLLPLEELLSGEAGQAKTSGPVAARRSGSLPSRAEAPGRAAVSRGSESEASSSRAPAASPFSRPSPFEADRNRKGEPKGEAMSVTSEVAPTSKTSPVFTEGVPAFETIATNEAATATAVAVQVEDAPESTDEVSVEGLRGTVLAALEDAGQDILAHNLEAGEWSLRGAELTVKVAMSQVLIDVALGAEPKRVIQTALNTTSNRPLKFKMVSGGVPAAIKAAGSPRPANGAGARSRAAADPMVQRMQEKFGAEIRTVIDHKNSG